MCWSPVTLTLCVISVVINNGSYSYNWSLILLPTKHLFPILSSPPSLHLLLFPSLLLHWCVFIWMHVLHFYTVNPRILSCVFSFLFLHGLQCQLRLSVQRSQTDGWEWVLLSFPQESGLHVESGVSHFTFVWHCCEVHSNLPKSVSMDDLRATRVTVSSSQSLMWLWNVAQYIWHLPFYLALFMLLRSWQHQIGHSWAPLQDRERWSKKLTHLLLSHLFFSFFSTLLVLEMNPGLHTH